MGEVNLRSGRNAMKLSKRKYILNLYNQSCVPYILTNHVYIFVSTRNVSRRISNLKVDDGSGYIKDLNALVQASGGSILLETDSEQIRIT